jgi:hypothetical protein
MNQILEWLTGGDLRSDGLSDEAAAFILQNPDLFEDLFDGLSEVDDVVRGRAADALEKVGRSRPELFDGRQRDLIEVLEVDPVPMVKMHIAMLLGHLAMVEEDVEMITAALLRLLSDKSVFAVSWAIVSLCIIGRMHEEERPAIIDGIARLEGHSSPAVRARVRKGLRVLTGNEIPFPKGWVKSQQSGLLERT